MMALSCDERRASALLAALGPSSLALSVINSLDQTVVSGTAEDLDLTHVDPSTRKLRVRGVHVADDELEPLD